MAVIVISELDIVCYCFRYSVTPASIKNNLQNDFAPNGFVWKIGSLRPRSVCVIYAAAGAAVAGRSVMSSDTVEGDKNKKKKFSTAFGEISAFLYKKKDLPILRILCYSLQKPTKKHYALLKPYEINYRAHNIRPLELTGSQIHAMARNDKNRRFYNDYIRIRWKYNLYFSKPRKRYERILLFSVESPLKNQFI